MSDELTTWRIRRPPADFNGRKLKVYSPGCATSPHAERNCRCRTFRDPWRAEQYVAEQIALDNGDDRPGRGVLGDPDALTPRGTGNRSTAEA